MATTADARTDLARRLTMAANADGGWSYYRGKASRLEPSAWALMALSGHGVNGARSNLIDQAQFLIRAQQPDGWLVENPTWPLNLAFNALVAFVWLNQPQFAPQDAVQRLTRAL